MPPNTIYTFTPNGIAIIWCSAIIGNIQGYHNIFHAILRFWNFCITWHKCFISGFFFILCFWFNNFFCPIFYSISFLRSCGNCIAFIINRNLLHENYYTPYNFFSLVTKQRHLYVIYILPIVILLYDNCFSNHWILYFVYWSNYYLICVYSIINEVVYSGFTLIYSDVPVTQIF